MKRELVQLAKKQKEKQDTLDKLVVCEFLRKWNQNADLLCMIPSLEISRWICCFANWRHHLSSDTLRASFNAVAGQTAGQVVVHDRCFTLHNSRPVAVHLRGEYITDLLISKHLCCS